MPSIDDILNNLSLEEDTTKEASATPSLRDNEIEKEAQKLGLIGNTKTASQHNEGELNMINLQDYYSMHYEGEEKVASAEESFVQTEEGISKEAAAQLEITGEISGQSFYNGLQERMLEFSIKTAMDAQPESKATKAIQQGAGVIPGAATSNPQLEVNKGMSDDSAMDTTPAYYSLLSKAVEKAKIKAAIESGEPKELSHQVVQVNAREGKQDLPVGGSQSNA